MPFIFSNNCRGYLAVQLSSSGTEITVQNGAPFPTPSGDDFYYLTLVGGSPVETSWEVVKVTGKSGNILTVERGIDGTSAQIWPVDTMIEMRLTAAMASMFQEKPYDIAGFYPGKPSSTGTLVTVPIPRTFYFDTNLLGSLAKAITPPSSTSVVLLIKKNDTQIGTLTFGVGSSEGVFNMTDNNPIASGSVFSITGNGSMDTSFADMSFTLKGFVKD